MQGMYGMGGMGMGGMGGSGGGSEMGGMFTPADTDTNIAFTQVEL